MGKHTDALGSFENFQAPWETPAGEVEIDKAKLKKYLFNVVSDKAKAQDARDEFAEKVTKAEQELETAKSEAAKGDPEGKIAGLEKKLAKAQDEAKSAQLTLDRYEVAADKGLTPKQAKYLQGEDREALEKSAESILEDFGVQKSTTQETDEEREEREEREAEEAEEAAATGRTVPRLVNPNDRKTGPDAEPDYEKIADQIASRRF